jgi:hypothetical protein
VVVAKDSTDIDAYRQRVMRIGKGIALRSRRGRRYVIVGKLVFELQEHRIECIKELDRLVWDKKSSFDCDFG